MKTMTTARMIGILTTSISGLDSNMRVWNAKDFGDIDVTDSSAVRQAFGEGAHCFFSGYSDLVRELWRQLPEAIQATDTDGIINNLFPHLHEADGYKSFDALISQAHTLIYDVWTDMQNARDKYGFTD